MHRRFATLVAGCVLVACSSRSIDHDGADGTATSESTSDSTTGEPTSTSTETASDDCDPIECAQTCSAWPSLCDIPYAGVCNSYGCECEPPECPGCRSDEDCPVWWQTCDSMGTCQACGELDISWDAELGCLVPLDGYTPQLMPLTVLEIGGIQIAPVMNCADDPAAWMWLEDRPELAISLCPESCAAFEAAGVLTLEWCTPGG